MEVKHLLNVNESALPKSIRREYNKIYLEFRGGYNDTCEIIDPISFLRYRLVQGKLFENEKDEEDEELYTQLSNEKWSEYIKEYHSGFKEGYSKFDDFLGNLLFNDNDNSIRINRVFKGVYNKFSRLKPYLIPIENDSFLMSKLHLYEFGFETGTFVKCWDIILNNHNLFKEIFDLHFTKKQIVTTSKEPKDQVFTFENNFDKVDERVVFEYFKTNLVVKKYISESILKDFLKLAFDKETEPKVKFSFEKLNTQKKVIKVFYDYYLTTAGKPYGKQSRYLNLLKNYFNGFENLDSSNFSK